LGLALALAIGAGLWLLSRDDDERQIRARIDQIAQAVGSPGGEDPGQHRARVERALGEAVAPDVLAKVTDHPELVRGRAALVELAVRAGADPRGSALRVAHVDVSLAEDRRTARVRLDAELSRPGDELHKDLRSVVLGFESAGGAWRVSSVESTAPLSAEPEARP
jgi:hypothetical protein